MKYLLLSLLLSSCALPKELEIQPAEFHATNPATKKAEKPGKILCSKTPEGRDVCHRTK